MIHRQDANGREWAHFDEAVELHDQRRVLRDGVEQAGRERRVLQSMINMCVHRPSGTKRREANLMRAVGALRLQLVRRGHSAIRVPKRAETSSNPLSQRRTELVRVPLEQRVILRLVE